MHQIHPANQRSIIPCTDSSRDKIRTSAVCIREAAVALQPRSVALENCITATQTSMGLLRLWNLSLFLWRSSQLVQRP